MPINENIAPNNMPMGEGIMPEGGMDPKLMGPQASETGGDRPDLRADIEADFANLENRKKSLEAKKIISKNKIRETKMEIVKKVFSMMQEAGIDPNNPDSIRNFLLELEESDPDLVTLFETAISQLSPEEPTDLEAMGDDALPVEDMAQIPDATQAAREVGDGLPIPGDVPPVDKIETGPSAVGAGVKENLTNQYSSIRDKILR